MREINQSEVRMKIIKDLGLEKGIRFVVFECTKCKKHITRSYSSVKFHKQRVCRSCNNIHKYSKKPLFKMFLNMFHRAKTERKTIDNTFIDNYPYFEKWATSNGYNKGLNLRLIDKNKNYTISNLIFCNQCNVSRNNKLLSKHNTSGYRGVSKKGEKWEASIHIKNKKIYLGSYDCKIEAAKARDKYIIDNKLEHTKNFS